MSVKRSRDASHTLEALARVVGVSRATASNAFNRPDQLSAELRERILRTAREIGYSGPDPTARALSRGRRGTVGLVFTEHLSYAFSDPAAVRLLEGIAQACEEAETGLVLLPIAAGGEGSTERAINAAAVDALALYSLPDHDPAIQAARVRGISLVTIDQPQIVGIPYVGIDFRLAAKLALSHLLSLGHRKVAILGYRLTPERHHGAITQTQQRKASYHSTRVRLKGYHDALAAFGLGWDTLRFIESESNDQAGGLQSSMELLGEGDRPSAILTDSDQLAAGALGAAAALGLAVPQRLSVIGMDDVASASLGHPALTTIRQPLVEKGRAVGEILLGHRSGRSRVLLPVELIVRESTGPLWGNREGR